MNLSPPRHSLKTQQGGYLGYLGIAPLLLRYPLLGERMDKPCFVDDDDHFKFDNEKMQMWYESAVEKVAKLDLVDSEIPYVIFLICAEVGLRCQMIDKLH